MDEFGVIDTSIWQETKVMPKFKCYINTDEGKLIHIIESGWDCPKMYSVIIEDGDLGHPSLEFLNKEQITKKYKIKI